MRSGIMLAQPFEERRLNKWTSGNIIQPKLDGERCRAVFGPDKKVTLYSSECNIITSVPHINAQLESMNISDSELDGELYIHEKDFDKIHSIVSRKVNQHFLSDTMEFHIFDIVDSLVPQDLRLFALEKLFSDVKLPNIKIVSHEWVVDMESIMEVLKRYKDEGYEGFILRHPKAPYIRKRSPYMMKFKPKKDDVYKIVGYKEEMSITGHPKGRLGAFILSSDDGANFSVGSGLNDNDRYIYWQNRDELIGKWCEVQYQHITPKNKVPRFPVFVQLRADLL